MKKSLLIFILFLTSVKYAQAIKTDMIFATVNEQAITMQELKNRITLTKLLIGKDLSSAEFKTLKDQSMEQLISEELQRQYAKDKQITISKEELDNAIRFIEQQRGIEKGSLINKIPVQLRNSALNQIKDSIYHQKILAKFIIPKTFVPDYEVDNLLKDVINQANNNEYKISRLIIDHTDNSQADLKKIMGIYNNLTKGDNFKDAVIAFSDGEQKLNGGNLGWFTLNELNQKLRNEVQKLSVNEFSKPIKAKEGWFILKVDDIKKISKIDTSKTNEYKFAIFKGPELAKDDVKKVENLMSKINGFSDLLDFEKTMADLYKMEIIKEKRWISEERISAEYKDDITNMMPGSFSAIKQTKDKDSTFVYLIDSKVKNSEQVQKLRARIEDNLRKSKANLKYKQLEKTIREKSFIEVR